MIAIGTTQPPYDHIKGCESAQALQANLHHITGVRQEVSRKGKRIKTKMVLHRVVLRKASVMNIMMTSLRKLLNLWLGMSKMNRSERLQTRFVSPLSCNHSEMICLYLCADFLNCRNTTSDALHAHKFDQPSLKTLNILEIYREPISLEAIATRLEAIDLRLEAIIYYIIYILVWSDGQNLLLLLFFFN